MIIVMEIKDWVNLEPFWWVMVTAPALVSVGSIESLNLGRVLKYKQ